MNHIYLIPGLGFDARLFSRLELECDSIHHIDWIEPVTRESITGYAKRISERITQKEISLIGHSFGGILSQEIANHIPVKNIFLISSISSPSEIPFSFKVISKLKLYHIATPGLIGNTIPLWGRFYDYSTTEHRKLAKSMILGNSGTYFNWALDAIAKWNNNIALNDVNIHVIHGTRDKTFPIKSLGHVTHKIINGGHFMVYKHAEEISEFINEKINLK